ncbi:galaxin-2-like [Octopus sinensis]|uniref:Galaxin-2-like n=1 Tax=Octopus sinensis TaxID=2607531 RepID=A0A6P7SQP2_9MOLL|nr:galaxin-2-like [Octopus sinensis]
MSKILITIATALLAVIGSTTAYSYPPYYGPPAAHYPPPTTHYSPPYFRQSTYYCNGQAYNLYDSICCGAQVTPITGFKDPACCGNVAFDRNEKLCCSGALVAKGATATGCCGAAAIDLSLQDCCAGTVIVRLNKICCGGVQADRKSIYEVCCGAVGMDKTKELCCNGTPKKIEDAFKTGNNLVANTFACCGNSVFNQRSNYCYMNQIYPRKNYVPFWRLDHHHHDYHHQDFHHHH